MSNSNFSNITNFGSAYINKKVVMYSIYIPKYSLDAHNMSFRKTILQWHLWMGGNFLCWVTQNYVFNGFEVNFCKQYWNVWIDEQVYMNKWACVNVIMCECEHGQIFQQIFKGIFVDYRLPWHGSNIFLNPWNPLHNHLYSHGKKCYGC